MKELTRRNRQSLEGRKKEGRKESQCVRDGKRRREKKEGKEVVGTHNNRWSKCCVEAKRQTDRSIGRSRQVHTLAAVGCLTDQYPPTTRNSRTGTQRRSDRLLLHTLLVGPSRRGRAAFSAPGRAAGFGSAKRECCRGWGGGQARATDWTEVGKQLPCERGVIRTLLRLLIFCCLFTLSFSRPKSSRLLAIPTLRTSFSSSSITILQLITSNTFFLVLDQVFSLFLIKKMI